MYTVVFADDEVELRQAILQRIDWEGLGFSVVADAENGVEALEAVEQYEPDLLITDIRMPLMTGIELARRVREVCPATQIVFLSGYDDFGYAQEAIRYNVNYECDAIAACVIGGVSFVGGTGKISGIVIGVLLLQIIFAGLNFLSVSANMLYIIKGLIILIACAIDMRKYLVKK